MYETTLTVPETIVKGGRKLHVALFDCPSQFADVSNQKTKGRPERNSETSDFYDDKSYDEAVQLASTGDMSRVAASDALLEQYEALSFESHQRAWADDVTGAMPNVPAYVAGVPLNMRRRTVKPSDAAPVAILVDLTSSAWCDADKIARRGAAIMALVRCLSSKRPVELWAGTLTGADCDRNGVALFTRIETTPLDLATASYVLQSAAFPRRLGYALSRTYGFEGGWAFGNDRVSRRFLAELMTPAMPHITESVIVPAMHMDDVIANEPEAWIKFKLVELGVVTLEAAE